jgi:hypothetical protein
MIARPLLTLGLVCCAGLASAQPAPNKVPTKEDTSKLNAQQMYDLGNKLFEEKQYDPALAVFNEAYKRFPSPKILLNIGITLNALGRIADAANAFQRFVDAPDAEAKLKPDIVKAIADLDKKVGLLELTANPADAQVQVNDGEFMSPVRRQYRVPEGSVTITAKKEGYRTETRTLSAKAGEKQTVELGLSLLPTKTDTKVIYVDTGLNAKAEGPRSRIGAYAMEHLDIPHKGAATLIGVTFDVIDRVRVDGAAVLGPNYGAYAGATLAILTGKFRPIVAVGMPIFFSDGARYGMRGAGGLELQLSRHLALVAELGAEFMLNPEDDIKELVFIPAIGAMGRL